MCYYKLESLTNNTEVITLNLKIKNYQQSNARVAMIFKIPRHNIL